MSPSITRSTAYSNASACWQSAIIAATIARFRRQVTILFITHRVPAALAPDRVIELLLPAGA